jgi:hypothetical protein
MDALERLASCIRANKDMVSLVVVRTKRFVTSSATVLERIGAHVDPSDFDRLVAHALEQIVPVRPLPDPRRELNASDIAVLEQGGFELEPLPLDGTHPLIRSAATYAALIASSLSVAQAASRLHVEGSRVRQRLGERSLYGIKMRSGWRLPLFQFADQGTVPGIDAVFPCLDATLHPLSIVGWFTTPNPDLTYGDDEEPVSPLIWLIAGRSPAPVMELASSLGEVA